MKQFSNTQEVRGMIKSLLNYLMQQNHQLSAQVGEHVPLQVIGHKIYPSDSMSLTSAVSH